MSSALLAEWLGPIRLKPGLTVVASEDGAVFCVDPGDGPVIAIEWDTPSHGVHLYGHPGHADLHPQGAGAAEAEDDEEEEGGGGAPGDSAAPDTPGEALVLDLGSADGEQRHLHVQGGTGLLTLSVLRSFASLDAVAFVALVDDFLADMDLWGLVAGTGGDGPFAGDSAGPAPGAPAKPRLPLGVTIA